MARKRLQLVFKISAVLLVLIFIGLGLSMIYQQNERNIKALKEEQDKIDASTATLPSKSHEQEEQLPIESGHVVEFASKEPPLELYEDLEAEIPILGKYVIKDPKPAPKTFFYDDKDHPFEFKDYRGHFLIVYFWASWCAMCNEEIKELASIYNDILYDDILDLEILPISIDYKATNDVYDFYQALDIHALPLFFDNKRELMNAFGVKTLPTTFLIDKQGYIIGRIEEHISWSNDLLYNSLLKLKGENTIPGKSEKILDLKKRKKESKDQDVAPSKPATNNPKKVLMIK